MATKTISIELDAYEKLKAAKRHDRESFSAVVRRARIGAEPSTGAGILEALRELPEDLLPPTETFLHWDRMLKEDATSPRISPSSWEDASDAP